MGDASEILVRLREEIGGSFRAFCARRGLDYKQIHYTLKTAQKMPLSLAVLLKDYDLGYILTGIRNAARGLHVVPAGPILPAPDGALSDPTFRMVWRQVTWLWRQRNSARRDDWKYLVRTLKMLAPVRDIPDEHQDTQKETK